MAKKSKQLKFDLSLQLNKNNDSRIHLDREDSTFAEDHYGFYVMGLLTKGTSHLTPRIYLSYNHKVQYFKEKAKVNSAYNKKIRISSVEVFDDNKEYINLIKDFILKKLSKELYSYAVIRMVLSGMGLFLNYLRKEEKKYSNIEEIENIDISNAYNYYFAFKGINKNNIKSLGNFFTKLGFESKQVKIAKKNKQLSSKNENLKNYAIPSGLIFQLEIYIEEEFRDIKKLVEEYWTWEKEFKDNSFITASDLLRTIFDLIDKNSRNNSTMFVQFIILKLKHDFKINTDCLFYSKNEIENEFSFEQKQNIEFRKNELRIIALNGRNIHIKEEKYAMYWMMDIFPKFPYDNNIAEKYKDISQTKIKEIRIWIRRHFNVELKSLDKRIFPQNNDIYPIYLLLLITTGVNQEVLKDWEIKKLDNGEYSIDGDDLGIFTIIDALKERSNATISVTLKNDSLEKKNLDFYIKWATSIYNYSGSKKLFQYMNTSGGNSEKYQEIDNAFLINIRNSPYSLFKKYDIIDLDGNKVDYIDHREIRKSHNYQDFLKGKKEYERQVRKSHKSGETTKTYYENQNFEWEGSKKHKIALAQNLIVGIFKGEIKREEHKTAGLFENGPIADCKNNKSPTFNNSPILKEDEFCSDWSKCLTKCNKACVIPKIHGPVIASWINYLNQQREEFLRSQDWEKEYLLDYDAANDTLSRFTEDEIIYSEKEAYKHDNFVKIKFSRTVKIKGHYHQ